MEFVLPASISRNLLDLEPNCMIRFCRWFLLVITLLALGAEVLTQTEDHALDRMQPLKMLAAGSEAEAETSLDHSLSQQPQRRELLTPLWLALRHWEAANSLRKCTLRPLPAVGRSRRPHLIYCQSLT